MTLRELPIELAGGPVSWGVDFAGDPANPPSGEVLAGIARAGLRWTELGPAGYLPPGRAALEEHGLRSAAGFVFESLHTPEARAEAVRAARLAIDAIAATGGRFLVVIDRPGPERAPTAERDVRAVLHPHAGSFVEFEDEIEELLARVPAEVLGLCLDTGHALYAGADPAALVTRHGDRLEHLHLKDVSAPRLAAAHAAGADFWTAIAQGVFCAVGDGVLDLGALRGALSDAGYAGLATVEQDRRRGSPGRPGDDLRRSVQRLRAAGFGAP